MGAEEGGRRLGKHPQAAGYGGRWRRESGLPSNGKRVTLAGNQQRVGGHWKDVATRATSAAAAAAAATAAAAAAAAGATRKLGTVACGGRRSRAEQGIASLSAASDGRRGGGSRGNAVGAEPLEQRRGGGLAPGTAGGGRGSAAGGWRAVRPWHCTAGTGSRADAQKPTEVRVDDEGRLLRRGALRQRTDPRNSNRGLERGRG